MGIDARRTDAGSIPRFGIELIHGGRDLPIELAAVGLQVQEGVVVAETGAAEEREAGAGVDEGGFEGIIGGAIDIVQRHSGEGEGEEAASGRLSRRAWA